MKSCYIPLLCYYYSTAGLALRLAPATAGNPRSTCAPSIIGANYETNNAMSEYNVAMPPIFSMKRRYKYNEQVNMRSHLLNELYAGVDPFSLVTDRSYDENWGYPHTNIIPGLISKVLQNTNASFWMEIGSMTGGSAIRTADQIKEAKMSTSVMCADPWTGDVNMWAWHKQNHIEHKWDFLLMDTHGNPRIYETFLANVVAKGHNDIILPLKASSLVSIRLMTRLQSEGRLPHMPQVIYLDSAHEKDETLMELRAAFDILAEGGILWGDDWGWSAVREDVTTFVETKQLPILSEEQLHMYDVEATQPVNGLILSQGQWLIPKPRIS